MARQTSIQLGPETDRQIGDLLMWGHGGSRTSVMRTAIDRMYEDELANNRRRTDTIAKAILAARSEISDGFHAGVRIQSDRIIIDTRISRDSRRRNNGGEYDYWLEISMPGDNVIAQQRCSCDFWQPDNEPIRFATGRTWDVVCQHVRDMAAKYGVPISED